MGASASRASRRLHGSERDRKPAPTNSAQNGGCVDRNEVATRTTSFAPNAQNLNIVDTTLSVVGGDVHNYYTYHYHSERQTDIWVVLQRIPNFRKIYQDILSKTTPGTGMWLVKGERFRLWLEPNGDIKIFWGSGIPGAGKTMLAAIVIARLEALCKASEPQAPICVCYVFFRYSERGEITVRSVLKVLVKQTLERHPGSVALVEKAYAQHIREDTEPSEAELLGLLGELSRAMAATFYVLDALDEAPVKIQLAVVRALASLNVKLFITSRPLKAVQSQFPEAYKLNVMAQDEDIDLHIAREIDQNTDLQTLLQQAGPIFREEIASTIKTNCGGMFLHASLQVEGLSECTSARSVRRMLKEFPPRIEDVYLQTWHRICGQSPDSVSLAKTVLVWAINASRSMTIDELELAMATCPDSHKLERDQVVPGTTLISLCRGLVVVEEKSELVRLIHYTAKEPLRQLLRSSHPCPHPLLAVVCMTHLVGSGFLQTSLGSEEAYKSTISNDPLLAYAADSWAFHAQRCIEVNVSRERIASFVSSIRAFPALTSFDRMGYFDTLSPLHVVGLFGLPLDLLSDIGDPNIRTCLRRQTPLIVAARSGHETLIRFLLALPDIEVNLVGADGFSALMRATRVGHKAIVVLLLGHPDIEINLVDLNGWSAVMLAARHGQPEMLSLLLARPGVQANLLNNHGLSALMLASYAGHEDGVTLLLARDDVSINQLDEKGMSALMLAARHGHGGVASLLLGRPEAQVNLVDNQGHSALILAAEHGWEDIVALLLKKEDIKVNQQDQHGWSALMKAARFGFEGVVALLTHPDIKTGINLINQEGLSASMIARSSGHPDISQNILEKGGLSVDPQTSPTVEIGDDAPIIEDSAGFESCHTVGRRRRRRVRRLALGGGYGTD